MVRRRLLLASERYGPLANNVEGDEAFRKDRAVWYEHVTGESLDGLSLMEQWERVDRRDRASLPHVLGWTYDACPIQSVSDWRCLVERVDVIARRFRTHVLGRMDVRRVSNRSQ